MKQAFKPALLVAALSTLGSPLAFAATADLNINAEVIAPLTITETTALNFGSVVPASTAATLQLTPAGDLTTTGGAVAVGGHSAGLLTITGDTDAPVSITHAASTTLTGPGDAITVDNFTLAAGIGGLAGTTLTLSGTDGTLNVGATLNLNADQAPGSYNGTLAFTVAY